MEKRKTELWTQEGWTEIPFEQLQRGDKFRLFDVAYDTDETVSTQEPVIWEEEDGAIIFLAVSDAYQNEEGIWTIDIVAGGVS